MLLNIFKFDLFVPIKSKKAIFWNTEIHCIINETALYRNGKENDFNKRLISARAYIHVTLVDYASGALYTLFQGSYGFGAISLASS